METACPGCNTVFGNLTPGHVGRRARCNKCGTRFIIPPPGQPARTFTPLIPDSGMEERARRAQAQAALESTQILGEEHEDAARKAGGYVADKLEPLGGGEPAPILGAADIADLGIPPLPPADGSSDEAEALADMVDSPLMEPILSADTNLSEVVGFAPRDEREEEKQSKPPLIPKPAAPGPRQMRPAAPQTPPAHKAPAQRPAGKPAARPPATPAGKQAAPPAGKAPQPPRPAMPPAAGKPLPPRPAAPPPIPPAAAQSPRPAMPPAAERPAPPRPSVPPPAPPAAAQPPKPPVPPPVQPVEAAPHVMRPSAWKPTGPMAPAAPPPVPPKLQPIIAEDREMADQRHIMEEAAAAAAAKMEPEAVKTPEPEVAKAPEPEAVKAPEPEVEKAPEPEAVKAPEPEVVKAPEPEAVKEPEPEAVKEPAAEEIVVEVGEEEEEEVTAGGKTEKADQAAIQEAVTVPSDAKAITPPPEEDLAAEGVLVTTGEEEEQPSPVSTSKMEPIPAAAQAEIDQDMVETAGYTPESAVVKEAAAAPMETVAAGPMETVAAGPMETVAAGPMETVAAGPMETVAAGPKETVAAGAPMETVAAEQPRDTLPGIHDSIFAEEEAQAANMLTDFSRATEEVPAEWSPGMTLLGLYEVTKLLGEGGMGKVYKVRHHGWNIDLAVKSPKPSELAKSGGAESFETEAETWVNLGLHPNTVSCYYVRRLGGIPRVFAEYVDGGSMQDWIKEGKLATLGEMLDVAIQFAWGLDYAHERGLVHQDIKPANVMMTKNGVAKVTDFGLAKAKSASSHAGGGDGGLVAFGGMTPAYCSPEQADRARLSRKTDMWSWALSILEMFVGETTWMFGVAANEALNQYLADGPVNKTLPKAPEGMVHIMRRCFNFEPDERPESMMDVADALVELYQKSTGIAYPRKAPRAGRATADSLNNRAISFLDLGRVEEAASMWQQALINEPHHPQSTYNFSLVNWRGGKIPDTDVVAEVEESVKSHGADSDCEYYLGLIHMERDDSASAVEAFRNILKTSHVFTPAMEAGKEALQRQEQCRRELSRLGGHSGSVNCLALAGGGERLFTAGDDHTVKQWDLASGAQEASITPDNYPVTRLAVTFDGGLLFTGGYNTVRMWSMPGGKLLREINAHESWISALEVSADATRVLTCGWDGYARMWSLESGEKLMEVKGVMGTAAMSGDGRFVLFGAEDGTARMVTGGTGAFVRAFDMPPGAMALSQDGRLAALAALDNSVRVFDARNGRLHGKLIGHRAAVSALAVNMEGTLALTGGFDKTVRLWDMFSGRCLRTFEGHGDVVNCAIFSPDSKTGVSCAQDGSVIRWRLDSPTPYRAPLMVSRVQASEIVLSAGAAYEEKIERVKEALDKGDVNAALACVKEAREQHGFSRGAEALEALGALYHRLPKKSLSGGWESKTVGGHTGAVHSVDINFGCTLALTTGADRVARLWDLGSFREKKILEGHSARANHGVLSGDGTVAVTAGGEGVVKVWDLKTGSFVDLEGHKGAVNRVAITWDKKFVISGGADKTVKIWDVKNRRILRSLRAHQGEITTLAFSEHGLILSGSEDRTARLWDMVSGKTVRVFEGHDGAVSGAVIGPDLARCFTAGRDGRLKGWNMRDGSVIFSSGERGAPFTCLTITYDGKFLATSDEERGICFWDAATGESVRIFKGHSSAINAVAISPDARAAVTCGDDKWIRVWTLDWELEPKDTAEWSDAATPWGRLFLAQRTPRAAELPEGREPFEKEIASGLSLSGKPVLKGTLEDFYTMLGHAGFGWLDKEAAKDHLQDVSTAWRGPDLDKTLFPKSDAGEEDLAVGERIVMKDDAATAAAASPGLFSRIRRLFSRAPKEGK